MSISNKLAGITNPNALIRRTVWSGPQGSGKYCCHKCKDWVPATPTAWYDPSNEETFKKVTEGFCSNLRVLAAYNKPRVEMRSYYYCSLFDEKEKENGTE